VAPRLVQAGFTTLCPDLRGYGRSTAPSPRTDHAQASKRAMAEEVVTLMATLCRSAPSWPTRTPGTERNRHGCRRPSSRSWPITVDAVPIGEALARADARFARHVVRAMLEDYRGGLDVDRAHDEQRP
jgi:haloacetate dehalogenase